MGSKTDVESLVGRSYTRGRRFPWVLGNFPTLGTEAPVRIPGGPYSMPQVAVFVVAVVVLSRTYRVWAGHGLVSVVFAAVVVLVPGWAVRRARVDGRPLHRALAGVVCVMTAPRHGRMFDRPYQEFGPVVLTGSVRFSSKRASQRPPEPAACSSVELLLAAAVPDGVPAGVWTW